MFAARACAVDARVMYAPSEHATNNALRTKLGRTVHHDRGRAFGIVPDHTWCDISAGTIVTDRWEQRVAELYLRTSAFGRHQEGRDAVHDCPTEV